LVKEINKDMFEVRYNGDAIKMFDDRREAIQYVDDFFSGTDDDRRSDHIYIFEKKKWDDWLIYSHTRNISYVES